MSQPNVLIVFTDQQSCWTLGCYGGGVVDTPNIDRLASDGARFTSYFTNHAWCTPARGTFFTGRYPHCHGAWVNHMPLNRDEVTFGEVLRRQGYDTGYAGKWHLDGFPCPGFVNPDRSMGFTDCRCMYNRGSWKYMASRRRPEWQPAVLHSQSEPVGDEETYPTDYLTTEAIRFIRRERDNPFCFVLSINDPHPAYLVRPPYDAMFRPEDMPVPRTFNQEGLPSWTNGTLARGPFTADNTDRELSLRIQKANYCGMVKLIDDSVGRVLDALEEGGVLDNTVVVFTTDHGDYMGEHGLRGKNLLYEAVYRIPLLVRWPKAIAPGTEVDRICSTVDFQQTLLGLMGVEPTGREQGADASPFLRGRSVAWEDAAFLYHTDHECAFEYAGIVTHEHHLVLAKSGESILFDRLSDPDQTNNLFGDPAYAGVVRDLTSRIVQHHDEHASPARDWLGAAESSA